MAKAKNTSNKSTSDEATAGDNVMKKFSSESAASLKDKKQTAKKSEAVAEETDPSKFIITIVINPAITLKSVNLNGVIAKEENFKVVNGNIICTMSALISTFTFSLMIDAEGEVDTITTFNMTCDDKKVFEDDQNITITSTGRGGYINKKVPLP